MYSRTFPARLDHLHEMLQFIQAYGQSVQFRSALLDPILLPLEEALVNIVHYAYPPPKNGTLEIICEHLPATLQTTEGIKITLKDQGIPFDPTQALPLNLPEPSLLLNKPDTSMGGYGLWILINWMDKVEYFRKNNENILTLIKYFSDSIKDNIVD